MRKLTFQVTLQFPGEVCPMLERLTSSLRDDFQKMYPEIHDLNWAFACKISVLRAMSEFCETEDERDAVQVAILSYIDRIIRHHGGLRKGKRGAMQRLEEDAQSE